MKKRDLNQLIQLVVSDSNKLTEVVNKIWNELQDNYSNGYKQGKNDPDFEYIEELIGFFIDDMQN